MGHYYSGGDTKTALRARAANFRAMIGAPASPFTEVNIDLAASQPSNNTTYYEAGNIFAKYYPVHELPTEVELVEDLATVLKLYDQLLEVVTTGDDAAEVDAVAAKGAFYESPGKYRKHNRIERNARLIKEVKRQHGYNCFVCDIDFEQVYGDIGREFIEAHHLRPLGTLTGEKVRMDPIKDFAVLCANCHRMVHRSNYVDDIEAFKDRHYLVDNGDP